MAEAPPGVVRGGQRPVHFPKTAPKSTGALGPQVGVVCWDLLQVVFHAVDVDVASQT